MRTGDADGDGIADILVGADLVSEGGETRRGEAWLIRGGPHLAATQTIDLMNFGTTGTIISGDVLKVRPATGATNHHFGATVGIGDLDANGRAELMIASTLNRAGASLSQEISGSAAVGGTTDGTLTIVWDDNVPAGVAGSWASGLTIELDTPTGTVTTIDGGTKNRSFGEEVIGGSDYDGDGKADLYVGDLAGDGTALQNRIFSGIGHVIFDAATLKTAGTFSMDATPPGLVTSTFLGAEVGDISGDTALEGDFDGDGIVDLAITAPHASPAGPPLRSEAGIVYVIHGESQPWPAEVDLLPANFPSPQTKRITQIDGALGAQVGDQGDVLGYSASAGDANGDGRDDLVLNEMVGNGSGGTPVDVGNLIVLSGFLIAAPALPVFGLAGWLGGGVSMLAAAAALLLRATRRP